MERTCNVCDTARHMLMFPFNQTQCECRWAVEGNLIQTDVSQGYSSVQGNMMQIKALSDQLPLIRSHVFDLLMTVDDL